jgi:hypothetical protein
MEKGNKNWKTVQGVQDKQGEASGEDGVRCFMSVWREKRKACNKNEACQRRKAKYMYVWYPMLLYTVSGQADDSAAAAGGSCVDI